jgi:uncharacterized membrane protein
MTAPTIPPADLLAQLGDLITATQSAVHAANQWGELLQLLVSMGYGPLITPRQIASLLSDARDVAEVVSASQEVPVATAAPKSNGTGKRRGSITESDREIIRHAYNADGLSVEALARNLGYSKSTINRVIHRANGGDAA